MQKTVILVSLLVLGWSSTLQGVPVLPDPLYPTQENFDLTRMMGTWYDVAVATTCPYMLRRRADSAIVKIVLQSDTTEGKLKMTGNVLRQGPCKEISGDYVLTTTPGRFSYHIARGVDVDAYVVHTNYNEYAIVIMSMQKTSGDKSTSVKLYSRTTTVRDTVLDDFKTLVRQQGMSDDTIIINQNKGECVPGEAAVVAEPTGRPQPQRMKRNVVLDEDVGSGFVNEEEPFNVTEACTAEPYIGPCFGLIQRYYYNSTSMSCETFNYGGCAGNQNNFQTERECLQTCRTEAACRLPMAAQPCTGQPPIFAFDSSVGLCVAYKRGFCQGNGNKFYSKAECNEYCGVINAEEELLKTN